MSADTVSVTNSTLQRIDTVWGSDGAPHIKLGIGTKDVAGDTETGAWQGVATHTDGATFEANDGVVVLGGVDPTGNAKALAVNADGEQVATFVPTPLAGALTDRSGTITVANTDQEMMAAATGRKYLFIQNLDAAEDLWINFNGAAAVGTVGSICLGPYESFERDGGFIPTQSVHVIATTISHKFTAKEG